MIGGRTRDVTPTAIFIRSGDVVLMSGESRYCYHAVPRMIANTCPNELLEDGPDDPADWADCREYIRDARINMNCRQVRVTPTG
jgi:alkylated DNA repair protein alkB family protein 1